MRGRWRAALAAAALAALLFAPTVGLLAVPREGGLVLRTRPLAVVVLVALAAVLWVLPRPRRVWARLPRLPETGGRLAAPALLALALALQLVGSRYAIDTATLVLIYVMLAWGLNIVVGLAGLLDLGYVAFYAVGAYTTGILTTRLGFGFWECLPLAALFAALAGALLGLPVLRLRGDYLAIVTLGFGEIIRIVLNNADALTHGPQGIGGIPRPTLFGLSLVGSGPGTLAHLFGAHATPIWRVIFLYYLILALALLAALLSTRLRRLPIGRAWEALREDEVAARALGIDVTRTKLSAFAIGASLAGLAGAFFAARASFISPESFTFTESATVLAIVVLGGMGSQVGIALAALLMVGGGEVLREALLDLARGGGDLGGGARWAQAIAGNVGQYRMLLFGLAMVAVMVLRPRGLVGERKPALRLHG